MKVTCLERIVNIALNDSFFKGLDARKVLMVSFLVAAVGAICALLLTDKSEDDQGRWKKR